jgi:hypothetical protein
VGFGIGLGLLALSAVMFGIGRLLAPSERFTSTCSASVVAIGVMLLLAAAKIGTTSSFARSILPAPRLASVELSQIGKGADGTPSIRADVEHDAGLAVIPALAEGVRQVQSTLDSQRAGARPHSIRIGFRLIHVHDHAPGSGLLATLDYETAALLELDSRASEAQLLGHARTTRLNRAHRDGIELLADECKARRDKARQTALCRQALVR